jgi:Right handed beta helix region
MEPPRNSRTSAIAIVVAFALLIHAAPGEATVYNVYTASQLISAVAAANANPGPDTINMAPGLYVIGENFQPLTVTDDLTVNGGARPGTVLDGGGIGGSAFSVHAGFGGDPYQPNIHATFNDLTIQNFHPGLDFSSGATSLLILNRLTITACNGDGLDLSGGPVEILNTTISGNRRGMEIETGDSILIDNCTIVGNQGNGIEKYGGPLTVRNSIIAYNNSDCSGTPNAADHDIDSDGTCGSGFTMVDPLLSVLADNGGPTPTFALPAGSPAIDAGSAGESIDQRGVSRPQGTGYDIGSTEWTAIPFEAVTSTVSAGGTVTTDTTGVGATAANPVQSSVTAPGGGNITIEQGPGGADFGFIGQNVQITAVPDATPTNPFTIVFTIDASAIPSGQNAASIVVTKNGVAVPPCTGAPGIASPDACVSNRQMISGGDVQITVLSSTASAWKFAAGSVASVTDLPTRLAFSIYPSPIRHDASVRFSLPTAADVDLSLFDLSGRKMATLVSGRRPAGSYSLSWHAAERLAPGMYFARFRAGNQVRTTTVVRVN